MKELIRKNPKHPILKIHFIFLHIPERFKPRTESQLSLHKHTGEIKPLQTLEDRQVHSVSLWMFRVPACLAASEGH